jgi:hypothetical protein
MPSVRLEIARYVDSLQAAVFKQRGYRKLRHTFRKEDTHYTLAFQLQGSDWNSSDSPWRFYLNVGIHFPGFLRRMPDRDFPTIHAWSRVGTSLSSWSEPYYEISTEDQDLQFSHISAVVHDCEGYFVQRHAMLRERYVAKSIPYLCYLDEELLK